MTSVLLHRDPNIFPQPLAFNPDRWLQKGQGRLDRYITTFGKGTRQCLGMKFVQPFEPLSMTDDNDYQPGILRDVPYTGGSVHPWTV